MWVKTLESTGASKIEDLEISSTGDFYLTGYFEGNIDLDPSGSNTQTKTSNGSRDVFILKLDSNGDYLWGNSFGSTNPDNVNVIRSLDSGVYVGGVFSGATEFQTGNPVSPLSTDDGYLVKYDDMGNFNFVYTIGGNGSGSGLFEEVEDVTEVNNTLVVSGNFISTVDFDNDPNNTANSTSNGNRDAYVLELTTSGDYINNYTIGGTDDEVRNRVHITNGNEIILYGAFESASIDLDPSSGVDTYTNGFNFHDIYFSHFSTPNLLSVDNAVLESFSVYPNPTTGVINIQSNTAIDSYIIYNQLGQVMKTGNDTNRIDINSFPRGLYMLQITSGNSSVTKKIVKQ